MSQNPNVNINEVEEQEDSIDNLRKREEEQELDKLLKKNVLGGYSKKHIQDYLNSVKEQQLKSEEKFNHNLKEVQTEKETLKIQLDQTSLRLKEIETKNMALESRLQKAESKISTEEALTSLEQQLDTNKVLVEQIEKYKQDNLIQLKAKINLEIDALAKNQKIEDLSLQVETHIKYNQNLSKQIETDRAKTRELIASFKAE